MFYLMTHSTHFIYGYMASTALSVSEWKEGKKEGNVLFNDTLNTFYIRLYGINGRVALAGMRNSSVGSPHEGSIRRPIAP